MATIQHAVYLPKLVDKVTLDNYLKMMAETLGTLSRNYGSMRKDIWNYFMKQMKAEKFPKVNYQEFLRAIYYLKQSGKLTSNENGYFSIQENVYEEIYKQH